MNSDTPTAAAPLTPTIEQQARDYAAVKFPFFATDEKQRTGYGIAFYGFIAGYDALQRERDAQAEDLTLARGIMAEKDDEIFQQRERMRQLEAENKRLVDESTWWFYDDAKRLEEIEPKLRQLEAMKARAETVTTRHALVSAEMMIKLDRALKRAHDLLGNELGLKAESVTGRTDDGHYVGLVLGDVTIWTAGVRVGPDAEAEDVDLRHVNFFVPETTI